MRYRLRQFMNDRYGMDTLGYVLLAAALFFLVLSRCMGIRLFYLAGCIVLIWELTRFLSKNLNKHWQENVRFVNFFRQKRDNVSGSFDRAKQVKEYKFFVCPGCKNHLRVPRGKGKLQITCPRCGQRFSGKT